MPKPATKGRHLDFPSVGATENIMAAAILAEGMYQKCRQRTGDTEEQNHNRLGACIRGAGTDTIGLKAFLLTFGSR